jgi:CubicO group peptidase (beta-lactamase class C family)
MGELLMNNGQYEGTQIIDKKFMEFISTSHTHSAGHYGGQLWLNPARSTVDEDKMLPDTHSIREKNSWLKHVLPKETYFMSGHDGQSVFVLPTERLVITRLGFTKETDYSNKLLSALMSCVTPSV